MVKKISFIIPVMNEQDSLVELVTQIDLVLSRENISRNDYEIIFIDDGSTDRSRTVIENLVNSHGHIIGIFFRKNYGKSSAMVAGFNKACGEIVITMDADLQDDPVEIPKFLQKISEGYDLVSGWKKVRNDPGEKVIMSRIFNWVVSAVTNIKLHDFNCGFKAYRSWCLDQVFIHGNYHRYIPVLVEKEGGKIAEIVVKHNERKFGQSKYGVKRYVHGLIDLASIMFVTKFHDRPMYFFGFMGLPLLLGGIAISGFFGLSHILYMLTNGASGTELFNRPLLIVSLASIGFGMNIFFVGLLAEMILQLRGSLSKKLFYSIESELHPKNKATNQAA